ncbi:MAG: hypothetical protein HUK04_00240 [Bacteroidaceae bacterium]|nr:hypothetical protein [Bacteroidaceae bacterium]
MIQTMTPKLIKGEAAMRREAKEKKELQIYNETMAAAAAGSLVTDICTAMTEKYGIGKTTFYAIRKRVEKRLNDRKQTSNEDQA